VTARFRAKASRPPPRQGARAPVWVACLLVTLGVGLAVIHLFGSEAQASGAASTAEVAAQPVAPADESQPSVVPESVPQLVLGRPAPPEVRPLFDPNMRLHLGETTTLKFAANDRNSRLPSQALEVTASVFHGRDREQRLPVHEVEDGVYEVPFQPHGPGQFQVVLNVNGAPAASQKFGVIGAAGRADAVVDIVDPLSVDPRDFRARTGGKQRRR
jgi:hypothetical protein